MQQMNGRNRLGKHSREWSSCELSKRLHCFHALILLTAFERGEGFSLARSWRRKKSVDERLRRGSRRMVGRDVLFVWMIVWRRMESIWMLSSQCVAFVAQVMPILSRSVGETTSTTFCLTIPHHPTQHTHIAAISRHSGCVCTRFCFLFVSFHRCGHV